MTGMTLALDYPAPSQSLLSRLDPRWKLAALMAAAIVTALLQTLPAVLVAGAGALLLVLAARLPAHWLLARLGSVALVLAFFLAWLPFMRSEGEARWELGWLTFSPAGLTLAALLLVKALAVVALMLALLASASVADIFKSAHDLRMPGVLVHLVLLTYRFVFVAAEEFSRLRTALRVRGFRNRGNRHSYRTVARVAGTLLVRSHDRAERVGQAMRCRGFDGCYRSLHEFSTRLGDVLAFALIALCAAVLLAWDIVGR
jgi:cobalt/nickel transport system permease protein